MNERLLIEYLDQLDVRKNLIKRIINSTKKFEKYLTKLNKTLDNITPEVLDKFLYEHTTKYISKYYIQDLRYYYGKKENKVMLNAIEKLKYKYTPPFSLSNFTIDKEYLKELNKIGIKTNNQLLNVCKTSDQRYKLSNKTNIPLDEINRITKLSDLSRIFAVKETRAQLYYESGIDTVEKISKLESTELINIVTRYIEKKGFLGIPTLPKEADFTVNFAKKLYKIVEW